MRYELADYEWAAIKPMLPNKPRGVPRVNDRRVLNGIFWVLRSGAPSRDLPDAFGPYTCPCRKSNPNILVCSPPRTGRQRMLPARSTARETGASFSKDRCVRTSL